MSRVFNAGADESLALCFDSQHESASLDPEEVNFVEGGEDVVLGGCGGGKAREACWRERTRIDWSRVEA